ncbi:hypothetical protein PCASD_10330 [Puccinia coronata f. sp. avenae]|uniref:SET domain-containing protein n=1 Tax=Puccinia coronata f. sp. avenae TaxID=200324 RepID=A0A2N5ULD2_9BASI|nr:hypothetical protein PCASD_10330 [Puccinia coronata f. sp. avenae]
MVNKITLLNRSQPSKPLPLPLPTSQQHPYTPAEKLTRADDLMSDVLDCFLWPASPANPALPKKRTIKFTPEYRRPRGLNISDIRQIIHSVQTGQVRNLTEATTLIRQLPAVIQYLGHAEPPRIGKHIGLYLQLFLPKCGIKFCETDRYDQTRRTPPGEEQPSTAGPGQHPPTDGASLSTTQSSSSSSSSSSRTTRQRSRVRAKELRDLLSSSQLSSSPDATRPSNSNSSNSRSTRSSTRSSEPPPAPASSLTHLAVFAARDYMPNDIIVGCEGSFADLTEEEDLKLRSNAHLLAQAAAAATTTTSTSTSTSTSTTSTSTARENTDFSHIVNSRGKFQVFCGPARFVNHDCDNNAVLLREGFTIKFKVTKPIKNGQEILTSYGMNYFGEKNCECMCATCERTGKGFYSPQQPQPQPQPQPQQQQAADDSAIPNSSGNHNEASSSTEQKTAIIKNEIDESSLPMLPSVGTDTDLSSLIDSSEGTTSRASNTPALEQASPTVSYSTTPSQRPTPADQQQDHVHPSAAAFVSSVKFLPTQDLTQPVVRPAEPAARVQPPLIMLKLEPRSAPAQPPQVPAAKPTTAQDGPLVLPVKRKTYWITTKQKQMGLVPWEADTPTAATTTTTTQPYSPATPSLLGPSRRASREPVYVGQKRKAMTEPRASRLPMRSYWVSTKEKQMGILPWAPGASADGSPTPLAPPSSMTAAACSQRATRASRRASEGMDTAVVVSPIAPRGSKLSYKIFHEDSQEAQFLGTAVGRELLGFRPRAAKKKRLEQPPPLEPADLDMNNGEIPLSTPGSTSTSPSLEPPTTSPRSRAAGGGRGGGWSPNEDNRSLEREGDVDMPPPSCPDELEAPADTSPLTTHPSEPDDAPLDTSLVTAHHSDSQPHGSDEPLPPASPIIMRPHHHHHHHLLHHHHHHHHHHHSSPADTIHAPTTPTPSSPSNAPASASSHRLVVSSIG